MIYIAPFLTVDLRRLHLDFIKAQGPGGQNVNKLATAVSLQFTLNVADLPVDFYARLIALAGRHLSQDGTLSFKVQRFRSQERNRALAVELLIDLLRRAAVKPKKRIKTKPTYGAVQRRLQGKKLEGQKKKTRQVKPQQDS